MAVEGLEYLKRELEKIADEATTDCYNEYAHNIYENLTVKKFITDIDKQYDYKPGFESEVEKLKFEILKNERDTTFYATLTLAQKVS